MKLDRSQLVMVAEFARIKWRDTIKSPHISHDEHLAMCWIDGLINVAAKDQLKIYFVNEEKEIAKEIEV